MKRSSLSTRLYRRVLMLLAITGLAMGAILYSVASVEIGRSSDAQLVNASRLLYMMMQDELTAGVMVARSNDLAGKADPLLSAEEKKAFRASYDWCMFAVFWKGQPVAQSSWGAPVELVPRQPGLHDFTALGERWRSYGLPGRDPRLLVVVAERDAMREFSIGPVVRRLVLPLFLLLTAAMVILWWTLRKSLSEVERLAATLNARTLADLMPLVPEDWSRDLGPLIVALNKLFARLEQAYELEQAFTDDVAHELRTPLAAIRAQAQLLRKTAPQPIVEDVNRLLAVVKRANDLVDGMLTLARLNATAVSVRSVDIHALVADVVAEALINLPPDEIEFTVLPEHVVRWTCDPASLQIALAAVIHNAVRHAREGGQVDIAIIRTSDHLVVTIGDRGPGVPAEDRDRLLRRFERGAAPSSGSGLGLSIAVKAMTLARGSIELLDRQDGPGLLVVLTLPAAR
ncbi:two-component system OmpR family sensor kinase/two-component system sensor histidine kinase QseC [Novosphingobium sp. PhB165]|uniref:sensor histidine kinase n=1 Tax=Novosphingobium sp. PhB165 TaxID=2485105 RepID=UPI001043CBE7|nr:HAMP domain-containing sensor histidine kinase [Novosphingobium sp. PhB165]TCM20859.1 two-component system OmpR family sensor kinase/two-component system sensor histidine kinase QseC [Novosphingobium sp. PhB165]